jgi:cellulose synthase operon protein C
VVVAAGVAATAVVTARRLRRLIARAELRAEFIAAVETLGRQRTVAPFVFAHLHGGNGASARSRGKHLGTAVLRCAAMRVSAPSLVVLAVSCSVAVAGCRRGARVDDGGTRSVEARLGAADRHRPFKPGRGALSLDAQAALERRGEFQALADAELLAARIDAADATLSKATPSPSVESDRAVIALLHGDVEGALDRLAAVVKQTPRAGAALWNRALVLRELGLLRDAAAGFDEVAALGEPGWSTEARAQAAQLRARIEARQHAWKLAQAAGKALIATGAPPPQSVMQTHPSYMRHFLYHALRAAPSVDRVRALAPLASTLDARDGGDVLATLVARTGAHELKTRAPLAATYARLAVNPSALDKPAAEAFLAALRRAHENDLLLGALILLGKTGDEMQALARATNDPWYRAVAADYEAQALYAQDKLTQAESLLVGALDDCRAHHLDYRCVYLESTLTDVYRGQQRLDDAQHLGKLALEHAYKDALSREPEFLRDLGDAARSREGFALMGAFLDEAVLADPNRCEARRFAYEMTAASHMFQLDPKGARAELDRAPRCDLPLTLVRAGTIADLTRIGFGGADAATFERDLIAARKAYGTGGRAELDVYEARFVVEHNGAAAQKLLDHALALAAGAPGDVDANKARAYAHLTRAVVAALADDPAAALNALAADVGAPPPVRCALGVAVDDERAIAVGRGRDGAPFGAVERHRTSPALDVDKLVPPELHARLEGCDEIAVFAPPPVHGLPGLLPPEIAWSYRLRAAPKPPERELRARRVVVANPTPPPSLSLPRLAEWRAPASSDARTTVVEGAAATPSRVLAEIADATEIELHAHGLLDLGLSDASVLALSPDASGRFALSARDVAHTTLRGRPTVILGACRAAQAAAYRHEPWGLPLAFIAAGAGAVYASPAPIGDADAGPFFAAVLARVRDHQSPARALRDERMRVLAKDSGNWVRQLLVFQ